MSYYGWGRRGFILRHEWVDGHRRTSTRERLPHAAIDPHFIGINVTKGDLGYGRQQTYTLYVISQVGIAVSNQAAGRLTVPDAHHAVQFQGCRFRIERLGNKVLTSARGAGMLPTETVGAVIRPPGRTTWTFVEETAG